MDLPSCQNLDLETKCSSHAAANLQCNTYKNRYATIIPCKDGSCKEGGVYCSFLWLPDDHSRVALPLHDSIPGSDYINASFIDVSGGGWGWGEGTPNDIFWVMRVPVVQ